MIKLTEKRIKGDVKIVYVNKNNIVTIEENKEGNSLVTFVAGGQRTFTEKPEKT